MAEEGKNSLTIQPTGVASEGKNGNLLLMLLQNEGFELYLFPSVQHLFFFSRFYISTDILERLNTALSELPMRPKEDNLQRGDFSLPGKNNGAISAGLVDPIRLEQLLSIATSL